MYGFTSKLQAYNVRCTLYQQCTYNLQPASAHDVTAHGSGDGGDLAEGGGGDNAAVDL